MKQQFACVCIVLLALLIGNAAAISVSPPRVELENVPKEFAVEKKVILAGITPLSTVRVSKSGEGSEWISLPLGEEFTFPDTGEIAFPLTLNIPAKAPNGKYKTRIHIIADAPKVSQKANSAAVSSGVFVDVSFTVSGEEVKQYSITHINIPEVEVGSPLPIILKIRNDGNVLAKPAKVDLTIKDKKKKSVLFSDSSSKISAVEPFSSGESVATFMVDFPAELYFADVNVHKDSGIMHEEDIPFEILEKGSMESSGELLFLTVQDNVTEIAKIEASFKNTGSIGFYAMLEGEVYRDGSLVDTFTSEQVFFDKGETNDFKFFYTISKEGHHTVKASAAFIGKKSNTKEVSFFVSPEENKALDTTGILIAVIAILAIYIVLSSLWKKKRTQ